MDFTHVLAQQYIRSLTDITGSRGITAFSALPDATRPRRAHLPAFAPSSPSSVRVRFVPRPQHVRRRPPPCRPSPPTVAAEASARTRMAACRA